MLTITKDSHLDHGLSLEHVQWLLERFGDRDAFFIETVELPEGLTGLSCGLHGPLMGDDPIEEDEVAYECRGDRSEPSRTCPRPARTSSQVTVIAGPHGDLSCLLYTVYGGPCAPREPADPSLSPEDREDSIAFWREHALSSER